MPSRTGPAGGRPSFAWATAALALLNGAGFAIELVWRDDLGSLLRRWGLVATDVAGAVHTQGDPAVLVTLITGTFLHAGWLHLLANLVYLGVFGGAVEGRLGHGRFLALYLLCGIAGGLAHTVAQPQAQTPAIGASGAVAGVLAAHLVLFPGAALGSLAPVLFFEVVENVPALLLLLLWLAAQLVSGLASVTAASGVAWWAHLGGFVGGLAFAPVLRPRRRRW